MHDELALPHPYLGEVTLFFTRTRAPTYNSRAGVPCWVSLGADMYLPDNASDESKQI